MKRILSFMLLFAMLLMIPAMAVSLTSVKINQIVQSGEDLYIFFHAVDENEDSISGLNSENVRVDLGGRTIDSEIEPLGAENIGYVFAIDVSASLSEEQFDSVQECIKSWIDAMNPGDQAAIVTYGEEIVTVSDFTDNKNTLTAVINGLSATSSGTMLYSGVMKAIDIAKRQSDSLPRQRVVVILSDGLNESSDTASLQEMRSKAIDAGIPLYVVGVRGENNSEKLSELGEVARITGGKIYTANKDQLTEGFNDLGSYIRSGFVASAKIPADLADGSQHGLILTVNYDGISVDDSVDIRVRGINEVAEGSAAEDAEAEETLSDESEVIVEEESSESYSDAVETQADDTVSEDQSSGEASEEFNEEEDDSAETSTNEGFGAVLKKNALYIYIGIGVLLVAGVIVYLVLMLNKRKASRKEKEKDIENNGYGGTGGRGGNGGTIRSTGGTIPTEEDPYATMMGGVIVLTDNVKGRSYSTQKKGRMTVGRNDDNDIVIPDGKVSGYHCQLTWDGGTLYVIDGSVDGKSSTNGTFLISNGLRYNVDSYSGNEFNLGDELVIGDTRLELTDV